MIIVNTDPFQEKTPTEHFNDAMQSVEVIRNLILTAASSQFDLMLIQKNAEHLLIQLGLADSRYEGFDLSDFQAATQEAEDYLNSVSSS